MMKQIMVVYQILRHPDKTYIGETRRMLKTRLREHQNVYNRRILEKSAVAEQRRKIIALSIRRRSP